MQVRILLFLLIFTSGCALTQQQRRTNRVAKKIERLQTRYPEAFDNVTTEVVRIDTVIQKVEIEGEATTDTITVDRILTEIITDTAEVVRYRTRLIENIIPTVHKDTLGIKLFIGPAPAGLEYKITRDPLHITAEKKVDTIKLDPKVKVIRRPFWSDWKFWVLVALIVAGYIFKGAIKIYLKSIFR